MKRGLIFHYKFLVIFLKAAKIKNNCKTIEVIVMELPRQSSG